MRLFDIPDAFRAINDRIDDAGGIVTDADLAAFDRIEATLEDKIDAIAALVRELTADADAFSAQARHFQDKAVVARNRAERLKEYVRACLAAMGRRKAEGKLFAASVCKNSQPTIRWTDLPEFLPEDFRIEETRLNGKKALEHYREHGTLPAGFEVTTGTHLRIG